MLPLGFLARNEAVQSWTASFPSPIPAVEIAFPLRRGDYLILNGSYNIWVNAHMKLLDESVPRFQTYRGSSDEPHLPIHAQRRELPSSPLSGDPLPIHFNGRFLIRGDRVTMPT